VELVCEYVMINDTIAQVIESQNTVDLTLNEIKVNVRKWSYVGDGDVVQKFLDQLYSISPKISDTWMKNRKMIFGNAEK
jgi:hypothetical protein